MANRLSHLVWLSVGLALLMAVSAGLAFVLPVYSSPALEAQLLPNDVVNLAVGVPLLLAVVWAARRGDTAALLFWPGALLYIVYNFTVNLVAVPLGAVTILYLLLIGGGAYGALALIRTLDFDSLRRNLQGVVHARLTGAVLTVLGLLFLGLAIGVIMEGGASIPPADVGLFISDSLLSVLWIVGGVALWRRSALGYALGPALLFEGAALFLGLLAFLIVQPIVTSIPLDPEALVTILVMSLFCFVPFGLLWHDIAAAPLLRHPPPA